MHPNLIPEHRFDATGRRVLRYVRPGTDTSKLAPSVPAPSAEPARRMTEGSVNNLIISLGVRPSEELAARLRDKLKYMSRDDFQMIRDAMVETAGKYRPNQISEMITRTILSSGIFRAKLSASMVLTRGSDLDDKRYSGLLSGLAQYPEFEVAVTDLSSADASTQKQVCAIASAMHRLKDSRMNRIDSRGTWVRVVDESGHFSDQRFLDTLVKYADRADEVASHYLERGNLDAIDAAMSVTSPLSEGAL